VTIAPSDRPIGTHVFTAEADKTDSNKLRWSVITVPPSARAAMRDSDEPRSRARAGQGTPAPVEAKPQTAAGQPHEGARPHSPSRRRDNRISEYIPRALPSSSPTRASPRRNRRIHGLHRPLLLSEKPAPSSCPALCQT